MGHQTATNEAEFTDPLSIDPARLAERYGPLVSSVCRALFRDREAALEAAQEAWVAILAGLVGFRGECSLSTWIYTVAYRRALRLRIDERRKPYRVLLSEYHGPEFEAPERSRPELELWARETCADCLRGLLFCLEPKARLVLIFRVRVGLSYAEIAGILGCMEPTVRQMASRARRLVANFMKGECAYASPGARCRCRNDRWVREFRLAEAAGVERVATLAERYRDASEAFPGVDWWMERLRSGESA